MAVYAQPERAAAGQHNRADGAHTRLLNRSERRRQPQHRHRRAENQVVIVKLAGKEGCQRACRRRRDHAQRQHRAFFSQRQRAQTGKRRHQHGRQPVSAVQQHGDAPRAARFGVAHVVDDGAVPRGTERAARRQPDHDGQGAERQPRGKARRALPERRELFFRQQAECQRQRQRGQRQGVVGAQQKRRHRADAHQQRGREQALRPIRPEEYAQRGIRAQKRRQAGVFLRQVAAADQRGDQRQIEELRHAAVRAQRPRDAADDAQAQEQRDHLLDEHGQRAVAARKELGQHLEQVEHRPLVVKNLRIRRVAPGQRRAEGQIHRVVAADARAERRVEGVKNQAEHKRHRCGKQNVGGSPFGFHGFSSLRGGSSAAPSMTGRM